jgi:hypothetical protein
MMDVFGECGVIGYKLLVRNSDKKEAFEVEDWARNVLNGGLHWADNMANTSVIAFWVSRPELLRRCMESTVEMMRVTLSALYGHIDCMGVIMMPEDLWL